MSGVTKIGKIATVLAMATAISASVLINRAEAQRKPIGNAYSKTGQDQQNVLEQFDLVNTTANGQLIDDALPSDSSVGLFRGAIANYTQGQGLLCIDGFVGLGGEFAICDTGTVNGRYVFNNSGFPIFVRPFTPTGAPFTGDLQAQLITSPTEPPSITYSIFRPGVTTPVRQFNLLDIDSFNPALAVNDLDYIIANNLLGLAEPDDFGDALIRDKFEGNEPKPIPESSFTLGLLAALGTGLLLKRQLSKVN